MLNSWFWRDSSAIFKLTLSGNKGPLLRNNPALLSNNPALLSNRSVFHDIDFYGFACGSALIDVYDSDSCCLCIFK